MLNCQNLQDDTESPSVNPVQTLPSAAQEGSVFDERMCPELTNHTIEFCAVTSAEGYQYVINIHISVSHYMRYIFTKNIIEYLALVFLKIKILKRI